MHYRNQAVCGSFNSEHRRAARELQKQAQQRAAFVRSRDHSFSRSPWKEDAGSLQKRTELVSPDIYHSQRAWCKGLQLQSDELGIPTGHLRHTEKLNLV